MPGRHDLQRIHLFQCADGGNNGDSTATFTIEHFSAYSLMLKSTGSSLGAGIIAGIVAGSLAMLALAAWLILLLHRRLQPQPIRIRPERRE